MPSININNEIDYRFKNELVLNRSSFNQLDQRVDKHALAQTIQNILIMRKGTYPNQPELGVGIEDYLFELADADTLRNIEVEIDKQLKMFVPTNYNIEFEVENGSRDRLSILSITFDINKTGETASTAFQLLFGKADRENKVVSKLIV